MNDFVKLILNTVRSSTVADVQADERYISKAGLFLNTAESKTEELRILNNFYRCLEYMYDYLDEYDEFYGLVGYKDDPMNCVEQLMNFINVRQKDIDNYERTYF